MVQEVIYRLVRQLFCECRFLHFAHSCWNTYENSFGQFEAHRFVPLKVSVASHTDTSLTSDSLCMPHLVCDMKYRLISTCCAHKRATCWNQKPQIVLRHVTKNDRFQLEHTLGAWRPNPDAFLLGHSDHAGHHVAEYNSVELHELSGLSHLQSVFPCFSFFLSQCHLHETDSLHAHAKWNMCVHLWPGTGTTWITQVFFWGASRMTSASIGFLSCPFPVFLWSLFWSNIITMQVKTKAMLI